MDKVAYVFPGQGSQKVGMGKDLYDNCPEARSVFEEADAALGFPLTRLCFEGPEEELRQTCNAQPAILTVSIAHLRSRPDLEGKQPDYYAGHSLGEYTALVPARALPFADAVRLARERGRLMHEAGQQRPGGMYAILGLEEGVVQEICDATGAKVANYNCPGQIVISGAVEDIEKAAEMAKAKGARSAMRLPVSGAFHTPLMAPAAEGMAKAVASLQFMDPIVPIVANTSAMPLTDGSSIKAELLHQLCNSIQWQRSVEYMAGQGVSTFIEIGPGQVLTGLVKRIAKGVSALSTETKKGAE